MDSQHHSLIACVPPFRWGWCTSITMANQLHTYTIHLADVPRPMWGCVGHKGRVYIIILALTNGIQTLSIHLDTLEVMIVPHTHLGHHVGFAWISRENPLDHYILIIFSFIGTLWTLIGLLNAPTTHFSHLRGFIIILLSYLSGFFTKSCH